MSRRKHSKVKTSEVIEPNNQQNDPLNDKYLRQSMIISNHSITHHEHQPKQRGKQNGYYQKLFKQVKELYTMTKQEWDQNIASQEFRLINEFDQCCLKNFADIFYKDCKCDLCKYKVVAWQKTDKANYQVKNEQIGAANLKDIERQLNEKYSLKLKNIEQQFVLKKQQLEKQIEIKEREITEKDEKIKQIKIESQLVINQKDKAIDTKDIQIKDLQQRLDDRATQIIKLNDRAIQMIKCKTQLQRCKVHNQQISNKLKAKISKEKQQIKNIKKLLTDLQSNFQNKLKQLCQHLTTSLQIEEVTKQHQNNKLQEQQSQLKELARQLKQSMEVHQQIISSLSVHNKELEMKYMELKLKKDFEKYFPNDILSGAQKYKRFIIQTLQKRYQSEVEATKLIHRYDKLNLNNLHRYIDDHYNILLLVKLQNGRIVAGFSNQAFVSGQKGKDGIIMAIQDEECYFVKQGMRAITYDDFYIIFGNSELRIKAGELLIFSNFGIANGYYQNEKNGKKKTVDDLFKEGKKNELPIQSYEIYEIIFNLH